LDSADDLPEKALSRPRVDVGDVIEGAANEPAALARARIHTLRQHLVPVSLATVVIALVMGWATWREVDLARAAVWGLALVAITGLRLFAFRGDWLCTEPEAAWLLWFAGGAAVSGVLWGSTAWVFYVPDSELHQLLLAFFLGGLSSGAAASLGCHLPTYLAWVVPAVSPLVLRLTLEGDQTHLAMASTLGLFVIAMALVASATERSFRNNVGLLVEKQALLKRLLQTQGELERANADLDARVRAKTRELRAAERAKREVERERRHAQKLEAIGRLTGGVAHDFNNVLAVVLNALPQIKAKVTGDAEAQSLLKSAEQATKRGAKLTESLLSFSRSQRLNPTSVDLAATLGDMSAHLLGSAVGRRVTVSLSLAQDLWPVYVDPDQLCAAVLNIAVNARDAMPNGGTLSITAVNSSVDGHSQLEPGDYVELTLEDEGLGMDRDVLERAFEPFFTTKAVGAGSGLGLSMVYGFAHQSQGDVRLWSKPGVGTRVTLWLPRSHAPARPLTSQPAPAELTAKGAGQRILLVEDEPALRRVVGRLLVHLGYRVQHVPDADRAAQLLADPAERIDLMLSDVVMPGRLDGFELTRVARQLRPELPIVLVSGYPDAHGAGAAARTSEDRVVFVKKPFESARLAELIKELLEPPDGLTRR